MKKIISIFTLQNVMKVSVCVFILLFALSTSFSSCASNTGKGNDSTLVENQDSIVIGVVEEPIKEEPAVKGVELIFNNKESLWIDYAYRAVREKYTITLDYDTGDAIMHLTIKERDGNQRSQTFHYKGSWKSTSVKRGRNYLEAFDVQVVMTRWEGDDLLGWKLREDNTEREFYFSEKFDNVYGNWDNFYEGRPTGTKIDNVKYITE